MTIRTTSGTIVLCQIPKRSELTSCEKLIWAPLIHLNGLIVLPTTRGAADGGFHWTVFCTGLKKPVISLTLNIL